MSGVLTDRNLLWAKRAAVHYLGTYSSSVDGLRKTIARRAGRRFEGITEEEAGQLVEAAVSFCVSNGFVNDETYAESRVAAGLRKGHSRRRIAADLTDKGVAKEVAMSAIGEADDTVAAITFARRRRIGPWRTKELDTKQRQREAAAFARNGFSGDTAYKVIAMDADEAEDVFYLGTSRVEPRT